MISLKCRNHSCLDFDNKYVWTLLLKKTKCELQTNIFFPEVTAKLASASCARSDVDAIFYHISILLYCSS